MQVNIIKQQQQQRQKHQQTFLLSLLLQFDPYTSKSKHQEKGRAISRFVIDDCEDICILVTTAVKYLTVTSECTATLRTAHDYRDMTHSTNRRALK